MNNLQQLLQSYLQSASYGLIDVREGFVVADRLGLGGDRDTRLHWIIDAPAHQNSSAVEGRLLKDFKNRIGQYPRAKYWLLAPSLGGLSRSFQTEARRLGLHLTVPILFFDAPFRHEEAPETASLIKSLRDSAASADRVPQPFSILQEGRPVRQGDDLFPTLFEELVNDRGPRLTIVVGPAGAGKSVLFQALFAALYAHFQQEKNRRRVFPRPIPLLPEYLRQATGLRTQELVESFLRADVATPVPRATFEWMLINGFSTWLLDGLDELYTSDPEFFVYVLDMLTRPRTSARFLMCARHSLVATSQAFASFLEEFQSVPEVIRIYRLDDWTHAAKRVFAWIRLAQRRPADGEHDPPLIARFLSSISKADSLRRLSSLPYYCSLLLDEFRDRPPTDLKEDFEAIERAVHGMVDRERQKGLLKPEYFEQAGLEEWLEEIALQYLKGEMKGIPRTDLEEFGELVLREELSADERRNALITLAQFPLFEPGLAPGTITFKHELVAEYLAGKYLARRFAGDPEWVASNLGARPDLATSLIARYLVKQIGMLPNTVRILRDAIKTLPLPERQFANLLQVFLMIDPSRSTIKESALILEGRDLSYVVFVDRDLRDVSFRNCELTGTVFRACDLRGARFEGSILVGTRFEDLEEDGLRETRFGDLEHFEYIFVGRQRLDDFKRVVEWARTVTGQPGPVREPCATALQLTVLFQKFVYPNGTGRRDELPLTALYRGKRYPDAPAIEDCARACIRVGFLQEPDWRDRVKRTPGDRYNHIVYFVKDRRLTTEMRQLLNSLCPISGCEHLP